MFCIERGEESEEAVKGEWFGAKESLGDLTLTDAVCKGSMSDPLFHA